MNVIQTSGAAAPDADCSPERPLLLGRAWHAATRLASSNQSLAFADQTVVSATNFLALVMIGRWTDPAELGLYAIGSSILALLLATQDSLVTRPYTIRWHRPLGTEAEHAFSTLTLSLVLSAIGVLGFAAAAFALSASGKAAHLTMVLWALAAIIPFVLLREFARRFAFAHLHVPRALIVDAVTATLNVLFLVWLGWSGKLSTATAFAAMGIACGAGALGWLYAVRRAFAPAFGHVRATLVQSWELGKWLFSAQLALQAQGYIVYWLTLLVAGASLTGIYTACVSIVSFANPVVFGFLNILTPRSVRTLRAEGGAGLRRQALRDAAVLGAMMAAFCLLIVVAGESVMRILYPAADYRGYGEVMIVLAVASLASSIGVPALNALASAERARAFAAVTAASALLNLILVWSFMAAWGLTGAAYGLLAAETIGTIGRWIAFLALVPAHDAGEHIQPSSAHSSSGCGVKGAAA